MSKPKITDLLISVLIAELVGALSGVIAGDISGTYALLNKPPLSPPGWVFPVVWAVLYALMGISAYLIYSAESPKKGCAFAIYAAQLFLNFTWSIVFFRFQAYGAAAAVLAALIIAVIIMIVCFARIRPAAAVINIPYLLWLLFAAYLNIATGLLN